MSAWEVLALRYAKRPVSKADVFYRYRDYGEPDAPQEMTYYLWLLRNADTTVLVDTGYSVEGGRRRNREDHMVAPLDALARVGVGVGDVDLVVNTHMHFDHTGYLADFADVPLLASRTEMEVWSGPLAERRQYAIHAEADEVAGVVERWRAGAGVVAMGERHEVAPGIEAIEVGGHSPGQVILVVEGEQAPVVLASDAVHFYEEVDRDRACGVLVDLAQVYRAYDVIRELVRTRGARLLAGHDPLVMERFPRLPGANAELGVRVA
jgi:glyoxylase-like metal-dependent hydrolase (beta-lactamase superfamily II)